MIRKTIDRFKIYKQRIQKKIQGNLSDDEFNSIKKVNNTISRVLFNIAKFMTMIWIMLRIKDRLGWEYVFLIMSIIILLAIINSGRKKDV